MAKSEVQPFGRYTLLRKLATGGMGEVFLARLAGDGGFEKLLVIKKMRAELASDAEFVSRFQDEAHVLVQLDHPAIARVYDMGEAEGGPFMALEFVDGKDLKSVLARCQERGIRVPTAIALHVMICVLDALGYAHRKKDEAGKELNLVHRDISPPNVLIGYEGEVKVIDFGLAKTASSVQRTQAGALVGKFSYMAPEAARHQALDRRADLFAAGVVLHEMLNGRHVLEGLGPGEVMLRVVNPAFPRLAGAVPGVSAALDAAIQRALSPQPSQRFSTAEEMSAALAPILAGLQPGMGPELVARFMQELFADAYAEEREGLRVLGGGTIRRTPSARGFAAPATEREGTARVGSFVASRRPGSELPTYDSGEYLPDDVATTDDPSMAATVFAPVDDARPDTAPSPVVRLGNVDAATGSADTVLSMRPVTEVPRRTTGSRPRPSASAPPVSAPSAARPKSAALEIPTQHETPGFEDDSATATVEARLDELPLEPVRKPAPRAATRSAPARRSSVPYVVVALLVSAALVLAALAVAHRKSAQRAGHLGQALHHRPAPRGKLERRAAQRQVELARGSR